MALPVIAGPPAAALAAASWKAEGPFNGMADFLEGLCYNNGTAYDKLAPCSCRFLVGCFAFSATLLAVVT
jgi:hypothetical protein